MKTVVVGVSDCQVSDQPESALVTYALGSCIAVAAYDPQSKFGGLLHFMLPESSLDQAKARLNPSMFADSGIQLLIQLVKQKGLNPKRCTWTLAGGAQVLDGQGTFQIGKRNYLAAKKLLWKEGLLISGEAVGGEVCRTVRLELDSGSFWIREGGGREVVLMKNSHGASLWRSAS